MKTNYQVQKLIFLSVFSILSAALFAQGGSIVGGTNYQISGQNGSPAYYLPGTVTVYGWNTSGSASSCNVSVNGGANYYGPGGIVSLVGGPSSSNIGGNVVITGGASTAPSYNGGNVIITPGTSSAGPAGNISLFGTINIGTSSTTPMTINNANGNLTTSGAINAGSVGIGISNPTNTFQVGSNSTWNNLVTSVSGDFRITGYSSGSHYAYIQARDNSTNSIGLIFRTQSSGTLVNAITVLSNGNVGIGVAFPKNTLDVEGGAVIGAAYSGTNTAPANGLLVQGNVGIGTANPDQMLTVKGIIHAQEVKVDMSVPADYVFKEGYKLMPLQDVELYVKANSHLPEIPSASEIKQDGMNMGEMQNKLLQKVEELTLYMIDLKKENKQLKSEIEQLKNK